MDDRLLTEIERQQKYLDRLPDAFMFPLFNAKRALESQRSSGYRNSAAAAREIVDNAIEAGAGRIHIALDVDRSDAGRRVINAIAFIDDGSGMLPRMARYALSWGGGTHVDSPEFIGKFGFGLPNASINQARRVEVYTRTESSQPFTMAYLDIDEYPDHGVQEIPPTSNAELPSFVAKYIRDNDLRIGHGTIVVWKEPDRLTYKKARTLAEHLVDDFGITYRYLLSPASRPVERVVEGTVELVVEGTKVEPVDPLFLLPDSRLYVPVEDGGTQVVEDLSLAVRYFTDLDTGERRLRRIEDLATDLDPDDPTLITAGAIHVRVARFPLGFVEPKKLGQKEITDVNRRFEYRKARRGMTFVRANREIETIDVFPRSARDVESGLGNWPLLQSYAYYFGIEVRFEPRLDEVFGITNDKQSVRPLEDFWRILREAGIDAIMRREYQEQINARKKAPKPEPKDKPSPGEQSAQSADIAAGSALDIPEDQREAARKRAEEEAARLARERHLSLEEARAAFAKTANLQRYKIDYFDLEDGPVFKPEWIGTQIVIWINRSHAFFKVLYGDLLRVKGNERAKEAVDVLLIALGRAELSVDDPEMRQWYAAQRKRQWSPFLDDALTNLEHRMPGVNEILMEEASMEESAPAADKWLPTFPDLVPGR